MDLKLLAANASIFALLMTAAAGRVCTRMKVACVSVYLTDGSAADPVCRSNMALVGPIRHQHLYIGDFPVGPLDSRCDPAAAQWEGPNVLFMLSTRQLVLEMFTAICGTQRALRVATVFNCL